MRSRIFTGLAAVFLALPGQAAIQPEPLGKVLTLPEIYPPHWILVHDVAFGHMLNGKTVILDADADAIASQNKGMFNSSLVAQLVQSSTRPEIYVAETYYSRGTRGTRTDVVTIYDKRTLAPIDEVIMPANNRAMVLPHSFVVQLIDKERLLLVFNFSPAMSVTVIEVETRKLLNEVALPGCAAIYPTGKRGFSSLCGDGALFTARLDKNGEVKSTARSDPFFDVDTDALFERPAWAAGIGYFPTFRGNIVSIDFRGDEPVIAEPWSLLDDQSRGWRPGGVALADADAQGHVYLLMHPGGREGSQSDPGLEVWRIDPAEKRVVAKHQLRMPGVSLALTRDAEDPLLVVTNVEMELDVYAAATGDLRRTLSGFGGETPLIVFGSK